MIKFDEHEFFIRAPWSYQIKAFFQKCSQEETDDDDYLQVQFKALTVK